jgi:hypothetical protein
MTRPKRWRVRRDNRGLNQARMTDTTIKAVETPAA